MGVDICGFISLADITRHGWHKPFGKRTSNVSNGLPGIQAQPRSTVNELVAGTYELIGTGTDTVAATKKLEASTTDVLARRSHMGANTHDQVLGPSLAPLPSLPQDARTLVAPQQHPEQLPP